MHCLTLANKQGGDVKFAGNFPLYSNEVHKTIEYIPYYSQVISTYVVQSNASDRCVDHRHPWKRSTANAYMRLEIVSRLAFHSICANVGFTLVLSHLHRSFALFTIFVGLNVRWLRCELLGNNVLASPSGKNADAVFPSLSSGVATILFTIAVDSGVDHFLARTLTPSEISM